MKILITAFLISFSLSSNAATINDGLVAVCPEKPTSYYGCCRYDYWQVISWLPSKKPLLDLHGVLNLCKGRGGGTDSTCTYDTPVVTPATKKTLPSNCVMKHYPYSETKE